MDMPLQVGWRERVLPLPGPGNARAIVSIHRGSGGCGRLVSVVGRADGRALRDIHFRAREGSTRGCAVRQRVAQARDRAALLSEASAGFTGRQRPPRWAALPVPPLAAAAVIASPPRRA